MTQSLTHEQAAYVEMLKLQAEEQTYQAAVVDYLGFIDEKDPHFGRITEASAPERRFGIRSMAHVAVYKFETVYLNKAAREAMG